MRIMLIYPIGSTEACGYAAKELKAAGLRLVDHPTPEVTHLLLDVPSFSPDGQLRGGGQIQEHLERLPPSVTVIGGNLKHPGLIEHRAIDLLQDGDYLAINAAITADCALRLASRELKVVFFQCPVLILGWGRIGKCLGQLLRAMGADVTIAARKDSDLSMIRGLGYKAAPIYRLHPVLPKYRVIFNTVPEYILKEDAAALASHAVKIDLASKPGIGGENVIWGRGLPGLYAPESSGKLIAGTFLKLAGRLQP